MNKIMHNFMEILHNKMFICEDQYFT